jgi:hypothetical protein
MHPGGTGLMRRKLEKWREKGPTGLRISMIILNLLGDSFPNGSRESTGSV